MISPSVLADWLSMVLLTAGQCGLELGKCAASCREPSFPLLDPQNSKNGCGLLCKRTVVEGEGGKCKDWKGPLFFQPPLGCYILR